MSKNNNVCSCCEHNHEHHHEHHDGCGCGHDHAHEELNKGEFTFKVACGLILLIIGYVLTLLTEKGAITSDRVGYIALGCFGISYLVMGFQVVKEAVEGILRKDIFNECLLMTIASLGAFAVGEYTEGCAVMFLYTVGEFLQSLAVQKSRKSIKNMISNQPQAVNVLNNGEVISTLPEQVKAGDIILIKPGEKVNIDSVVVKGTAQVDMMALTGESIPVTKTQGDEILAGCVVVDGALTLKATKPYKESTVSRILEMLEEAEDKKSHAEHFIRKFARVYTPIVCLISLLIMIIPIVFLDLNVKESIYRGLSALVVSCPCALVISIPLGFFGGIGACSKAGILVKGGNYLEALARFDTACFDKTGTVTSGKFEYVECNHNNCHCSDSTHRDLLKVIAACERNSTHPLAKSINVAFGHYADNCVVENSKNYSGLGVSAVVDGIEYFVGNEKLMQRLEIDYKESKTPGTAVYCSTEKEFIGSIIFADIIKTDSKNAIKLLKNQGIKDIIMLTGDKQSVAQEIAKQAGIDKVYSKLLPDQKLERVRELQKQGKKVLFVGDGINDAPVLAAADVGAAMGGIGSDIAIEASDMVIMGDSLSKLPLGRKIAKKTLSIVYQNIILSLLIKLVIIVLCAIGILDENAMWVAVFGDVGVCLIAIANSLRAMIVSKKDLKGE